MEYGLRALQEDQADIRSSRVLILVLMEYGLRVRHVPTLDGEPLKS